MSYVPNPTPSTHPDPSAEAVAELLTRAAERRGGPIPGTQLAVLIKATFPDFTYQAHGTQRLREFIEQHVPRLAPAGRQGMDVLYQLADHIRVDAALVAPSLVEGPTPTAVWRALVSPNSDRVVNLQVDRTTGSWRTVSPGTMEGENWLTVRPIEADTHRALCREFVESLEDPETRHALGSALTDIAAWWPQFSAAFVRFPGARKQFAAFRARQLRAALRTRLTDLGLTGAALETALDRAAPPERMRPHGAAPLAAARGPLRAEASSTELRQFVLKLIGVLPESELREIRVRLGDVFDALQQR